MRTPLTMKSLAWLAAMGLFGASVAHAQDATPPNGDVEAVRAAAVEYLAAMRRGDFARAKSMWTPEGDYIDAAGQRMKAADLFAGLGDSGEPAPETEAPPQPDSKLRIIAPGVAVEDGTTGYRTAEDGSRVVGRFTAVWVERDGKWLLDNLRESESTSGPGHPQLQPLDWLVGQWAGATDDAAVLSSWQWSEGGHFLVGEFVIYGPGREPVGGTQRIGWDPTARSIRSWVFDSQGSMGEGTWRRDGKRWIVESEHVTSAGKKSKTSAAYARGDAGELIVEVASNWDSTDANSDGDKLPPQRFELRRAAGDE